MSNLAHLPTAFDAELAQAALRVLEPLTHSSRQSVSHTLQIKPQGSSKTVTITLPREAITRLLEVLAQMANGSAVTIVPVHAEFTTQEAAEFLNVSRPFLVALLEEKKIPFRLVGTHRRVRFDDLVSFKRADDVARAAVLEALAADAQDNEHGY